MKSIFISLVSAIAVIFFNCVTAQTITKISNPSPDGTIDVFSNRYLNFNDNLYCSYQNADTTYSILKTDGSSTSLISNSGFSFKAKEGAYPFIAFNNKVFVNCKYAGFSKSVLGYIDGDTITKIPNISADDNGILEYSKAIYNDNLYFGYDGQSPYFLFRYFLAKYDGSTISTIPFPTTNGSMIILSYLIPFKGNLCYGYIDLNTTYIASYNGTTTTLYQQPSKGSISNFKDVIEFNGSLFFPYNQSNGNYQLAKFDGNSIQLIDNPDSGSGFSLTSARIMNGNMYWIYTNSNNVMQLAKCDGNTITLIPNPTNTGQVLHSNIPSDDGKFVVFNNNIYMDYMEGGSNNIIMKCDGQTSSIILPPPNTYFMSYPTVFNNHLIATATSFTNQYLAQLSDTSLNLIPNANSNDIGPFSILTTTLGNNLIASYYENTIIDKFSLCKVSYPLTVQLLSFTTTANNSHIILDWQTANEVNNIGFVIEESNNGLDFKQIGLVGPNTTNKYTYHWDDASDGTYYFRLKQIDNDGKVSYSDIQKQIINCYGQAIRLYPNPASSVTNIYLGSVSNAMLKMIDTKGKIVKGQNLVSGNNAINVSGLGKGMYIVQIVSEGVVKTDKLMIQ